MDNFENAFESRHRKHVANCPRCKTSHSYVDVKHPLVNDPGYWVVQCSGCSEPFCIAGLHDVFDSYGSDIIILARQEGDVCEAEHPVAQEVARHNLDLNKLSLVYDYDACQLYECTCSRPLDNRSISAQADDGDLRTLRYGILFAGRSLHTDSATPALLRLVPKTDQINLG